MIALKTRFKFFSCFAAIIFLANTTTSFASADSAKDLETVEKSRQLIVEMESKLRLPGSAYPLSTYSRFYSITAVNGHQRILVQYRYDPAHAGIHMVKLEELPKTMDGGCAVIHIEYDAEEKAFNYVTCGGVA